MKKNELKSDFYRVIRADGQMLYIKVTYSITSSTMTSCSLYYSKRKYFMPKWKFIKASFCKEFLLEEIQNYFGYSANITKISN
jgi:hypothetical protein